MGVRVRCPRCGDNTFEPSYGALSRWDDDTLICSGCGREEAVIQFVASKTTDIEDPRERRKMLVDLLDPKEGVRAWATQ